MDIHCAIVVKVGFGGLVRNDIRIILMGVADDLAERNINLAWNTEYDWIYDKRTRGSQRRWAVVVYGDTFGDVIKATLEARIENYFATGDVLGLDDTALDLI